MSMQVASGHKKDYQPQEVEVVSQSKVVLISIFAPDSCSKVLLVTKACISLNAILLYTCSNYDKGYYK